MGRFSLTPVFVHARRLSLRAMGRLSAFAPLVVFRWAQVALRRLSLSASSPFRGPKDEEGGLCLLIVILFCLAGNSTQAADPASNLFRLFNLPTSSAGSNTPHPAIVRVIVEEGKAQACGSGSLVGARDQYGLVVTNWHVVRDATGKIEVVFPDGFRSAATVLKTDELWDLAALLVWRKGVPPLKISHQAPQPGDMLTIAGYGPGDFRAISGKCTQYVAPSEKAPYEIVELAAQARQGDSGGPILNDRGELAGVLFGANRNSTTGSYCARVRAFLTSVWPELDSSLAGAEVRTPPEVHTPIAPEVRRPLTPEVSTPLVGFNPTFETTTPVDPPAEVQVQTPLVSVDPLSSSTIQPEVPPTLDLERNQPITVANIPPPPQSSRSRSEPNWDAMLGDTNWDRAKTVFAIIGLLTVWGHVARMIAK